jgi:DNA-binding transcriptional MerR regulator
VDNIEKSYTTKEISLTLDIGTSTLRKWCIALEENGYTFIRNMQNGRSFLERDIVALKHFGHLVQKENFTLENASKIVSSKYQGEAFAIRTPAVLQDEEKRERDFERYDEVVNLLKEQIEFNRELLERLNKQQKYIEERLDERDKQLIESIKVSQETKKEILQLAAAQEEKKSLWSKLFGK